MENEKFMICEKCKKQEEAPLYGNSYPWMAYLKHRDSQNLDDLFMLCPECQSILNDRIHELILNFIQPERSKREDFLEHYLCWEIPLESTKTEFQFCTYSKEDALEWHESAPNRSYNTHTYNKYKEMRCSEHCGNTVRDK